MYDFKMFVLGPFCRHLLGFSLIFKRFIMLDLENVYFVLLDWAMPMGASLNKEWAGVFYFSNFRITDQDNF